MCLAAAVYAEQLLPKGHGYPLWIPEPDTTDDEVRIGDVGYIWEGSFCTLFNATLPASHLVNRNGVPESFVPLKFNTTELVRIRDTYLPDAPVCSQTVRCLTVVAQAGTSSSIAPLGGQTHVSFECVRNKGGLLILNGGGAIQEVLRPNKTFPEYMRTYHHTWCDFAAQRGHDVLPEDIIMVRGTVKSSEWTVAAFMDENRHQSLDLEAQGGGLGSAGVALSLSVASSMSVEHRSGRSTLSHNRDSRDALSYSQSPRNQCVFLSRYKIQYRKWLWKNRKIRAAGYHDDEPFSDSDSENDASTESSSEDEDIVDGDSIRITTEDPLGTILNYILKNSECDAAIASDEDLKDLHELGYSTDTEGFMEQLQALCPRICVSAGGVGSLANVHLLDDSCISINNISPISAVSFPLPHPLTPTLVHPPAPSASRLRKAHRVLICDREDIINADSSSSNAVSTYGASKERRGSNTALWPSHVEEALIEGIERYVPPRQLKAHSLGRYLMRNKFVSDYIFQVTGHRRTPKQVASRLQNLRDTFSKTTDRRQRDVAAREALEYPSPPISLSTPCTARSALTFPLLGRNGGQLNAGETVSYPLQNGEVPIVANVLDPFPNVIFDNTIEDSDLCTSDYIRIAKSVSFKDGMGELTLKDVEDN